MNYYNEHDRKAAAWLRELINARIIPNGHVDERSIVDVQPSDLSGYTQCHFFAGIGGWAYALQIAGLGSSRPVWTGSCPCQPFSVAGKRKGNADERHLWPAWFRLIRECKPSTIFGEQVASPDALQWWDGVSTDMEGEGYACGSADLCAASVGAPHIRQRLYWVADADGGYASAEREQRGGEQRLLAEGGDACRLADAPGGQCEQRLRTLGDVLQRPSDDGANGRMVQPKGAGCEQGIATAEAARYGGAIESAGGANAWSNFDIIQCLDGKARRVESQPQSMDNGVSAYVDALRIAGASEDEIRAALCTFPLVQGGAGRVMLLRGYGNAIVPQVAAEFVKAFLTT